MNLFESNFVPIEESNTDVFLCEHLVSRHSKDEASKGMKQAEQCDTNEMSHLSLFSTKERVAYGIPTGLITTQHHLNIIQTLGQICLVTGSAIW